MLNVRQYKCCRNFLHPPKEDKKHTLKVKTCGGFEKFHPQHHELPFFVKIKHASEPNP